MIYVIALNSVKEKHGITDEMLSQIEGELNEKFAVKFEFQVYLDVTDEGLFQAKSYTKANADFFKKDHTLSYTSESTESHIAAAASVIESTLVAKSCQHADCAVAVSNEGLMLTNGVAQCVDCHSISRLGYLKPIKGNQTISLRSLSFSDPRYYVTQFNWADIGIQGGERGVVIGSRGARRTAFFEAFPTIGSVGTFIRGEGDSIKDAEADAWAKYTKQTACEDHEWSRVFKGNERTDGYAICTKCGLKGKALEPLTKCHICDSPTTKEFNDKHICLEHHNELTFEQLYDERKKLNQSRLDDEDSILPSLDTQHEVDVENFEDMIALTFEVAYRDERLKRGLQFPVEEYDMTPYHFLASFKENVLGIPSYRKPDNLPKPDNRAMAHNLEHIKNNMSAFVDAKEAGETGFAPLIIGMLRVSHTKQNESNE